MIFRLFRRSSNEVVVERLYAALVDAARRPALYAALGIPDTFEGRFESLTLHAVLVLRRLREQPMPGPELAQHLVDTVFRHFDRTLREMGVGDTSVPKRMKRMAEAFLGRSSAYDEALRNGEGALAETLRRNVYVNTQDAGPLAAYCLASVDLLASIPLQAFVDASPRFADPAMFADKRGAQVETIG